MKSRCSPLLRLAPFIPACLVLGPAAAQSPTIARVWNEENLEAIRIDLPHPPVHARNLFHLSVAMYDAWAAYDPVAVGYVYRAKHVVADVAAARRTAISYAAYRTLRERYALSRNAGTTLANLDNRMIQLGLIPGNRTTDPVFPAGVGNRVAAALAEYTLLDGARQAQGYAGLPPEQGGWVPSNPYHSVLNLGPIAIDPNKWQPLSIAVAFTQNGLPISSDQSYVGVQWAGVRPFSLTRTVPNTPWIDPGPPPALGGLNHQRFLDEIVDVIRKESQLTPDAPAMIDISPGAYGNNPLGSNSGTGHPINPVTGLPYPAQPVKLGDFGRVLAEHWADGPHSETPPGHWNVIANQAVAHPLFRRQIGGTGPELDPLEWDVKMYFAMNGALHDAACAAWTVKRFYEGNRPISMIRYMASKGQSSDPQLPAYHPHGLPLVPDLIELVTASTAGAGGKHEGLTPGTVAVVAWPGQPTFPSLGHSGVRWIAAAKWNTYQASTFVTPAFPGYISGHSTFSRAAAEVLTAMTGTPYFPGGMGEFLAARNFYLAFERGPSTDVRLQWATYYDAADQAGQSRLWGGIHVEADDFSGRITGSQCGTRAWNLAKGYFDGSIASRPFLMEFGGPGAPIACETVRGFHYKLQSSPDLQQFTDVPGATQLAEDSILTFNAPVGGDSAFYRVIRSSTPLQ